MSDQETSFDRLLARCFHMDWKHEFGTIEEATAFFLDQEGPESAVAAMEEIDGWLDGGDESMVERLRANFGGYGAQPANARPFLEATRDALRSHLASRRRHRD